MKHNPFVMMAIAMAALGQAAVQRASNPLNFTGGKRSTGVRMPNHKRGAHPCRRLVRGPHSEPHIDDLWWKGAKWRFHYNSYGQLTRRERAE